AISRAKQKVIFPAKFQLIAAMNPCPCGNLGNKLKECICSDEQIARYQGKLSGPLLERIDLHVDVPLLPAEMLTETKPNNNETSAIIKQRVQHAIKLQIMRNNQHNSCLSNNEVKSICKLNNECKKIIQNA